ncbi:MAG: flagellar motor protein MotA [Thalassospira sp.]|uniref:flagellar motor protein MotA n=1 Tax=Thalassospira sp. UBA4513 TaxID=1947675 RepID=UPI000C570CBF|nr:flagellar motor protein MotA [Thalassospira sp. UBA4513]MBE69281.1 flagellar motor protein MotA [Thalassospira sp.]HAI31496.1 flagellar motor protein MotA [Thalassospira sp.]
MSSNSASGTGSLPPITKPGSYLTRMAIFVAIIAGVGALLFPALSDAFMANAVLNGLILGVFVVGVIYTFRMAASLSPEVTWIEDFRRSRPGLTSQVPPKLLAPMASMMAEQRRDRPQLSTTSTRTILDSIRSRLDESRELSRYVVGLLVFLGLLGTFWGLLQTVNSVAGVISNVNVGSGSNMDLWFSELKDGLSEPLSGMGTAFSSSLFGLAGSLALGLLDMQAGQAQNRFFNDLEEWLSSFTRLGSGGGISDGEQSVPAYLSALIEQMADNMEGLQNSIQRSESSQIKSHNTLIDLADKLSTLTDQMKAEQQLMVKLAENQMHLKPVLDQLADSMKMGSLGIDDNTRAHIRSLDNTLGRIGEELTMGRQQSTQEIRSEIKLLARTIAAIAEEG